MTNIICWICEINKSYKEYKDTELLNEDGDKPCIDCVFEHEAAKEDEAKE